MGRICLTLPLKTEFAYTFTQKYVIQLVDLYGLSGDDRYSWIRSAADRKCAILIC